MQKEPILSSFSRILQAWACYDSSANWKGGPPPEHEQWYIHAVQAFLWKVAGTASSITDIVAYKTYGLC